MYKAGVFRYLIERHTGEEHHHVDDFVHDDGSLEADEEEHATADVNPVFNQHSHDHVAQNLHDVLLPSFLRLLFLYKTQQQIRKLYTNSARRRTNTHNAYCIYNIIKTCVGNGRLFQRSILKSKNSQ